MGRKQKDIAEPSPETLDAYARTVALAHRLAAALTGETLSPQGQALGLFGLPVAMAMMLFLLRIPRGDLHAIFFVGGSLKDCVERADADKNRGNAPPIFLEMLAGGLSADDGRPDAESASPSPARRRAAAKASPARASRPH